jgi:hypothetical protein
MLKLTLSYDHDLENPSEFDGWKLYSFCRRHASFKHPADLGLGPIDLGTGLPKITNPGLRSKFAHGLAHVLSYYEHGNCIWFLHGDEFAGVEFRWDGVRVAGLLVWEGRRTDLGPTTLEGRRQDAAGFLQTYTSWAYGEGFGYSIEDQDGNHVDSCYGFYGNDLDHMFQQIMPHLEGQKFEVEGEAAWLAEYHLTK